MFMDDSALSLAHSVWLNKVSERDDNHNNVIFLKRFGLTLDPWPVCRVNQAPQAAASGVLTSLVSPMLWLSGTSGLSSRIARPFHF